MANTHTTNKQRKSRILAHKERALQFTREQTTGQNAERDKVLRELNALHVNGTRYGNHRKMYAEQKVQGRRHERKVLNREAQKQAREA